MKANKFYKNLAVKIGEENLKKIQGIRIGLAGAGGLGSNCALNLVRVGFRKFTIADFDVIDHSNLDRQFYFLDQVGMDKVDALKTNLCRVNPDLDLKTFKNKLEKANVEECFADCSIVAECLDFAEYKSMLVSELLGLNKFVVSVSGVGGIGSSDDIIVRRLKKNFILIGDLKSDISQKPALSPRVNVAAAKQADVIFEYALACQE